MLMMDFQVDARWGQAELCSSVCSALHPSLVYPLVSAAFSELNSVMD